MIEGYHIIVRHRDCDVTWLDIYLAGFCDPDEGTEAVRASLSDPTVESVLPFAALRPKTAKSAKLQPREIRRLK